MGVLLSSTKTVYRTVVTGRGKRKDRKGVIRFPFFSLLLFLLTLNTQMIFRTEKNVFCVGKICWKRLARFLWSYGNTCDAVSQQTFLVFQEVFKTYLQYVFWKRLQDVFKMSSRRCLAIMFAATKLKEDSTKDFSPANSVKLSLLRRGVVVITTAQLHSPKPELSFCAGSNPARGVSEIREGEDLWQWSRLEIRLRLSSVNDTTKTIHHHHHHHHKNYFVEDLWKALSN